MNSLIDPPPLPNHPPHVVERDENELEEKGKGSEKVMFACTCVCLRSQIVTDTARGMETL